MTLTRIRAGQISDIDYKQAVRVLELANVTLSGGTPSTVDGVSLNINDRILVAGQSTASQNGLYDVSIVGSGSNGTWIRTSDSNETGEINAGMIVMVTEGTEWSDTSWKLITNNPITIGTTALTFLQNTGNSFSIINVVGSANVVANGVSSTVSFASGNNISITGNSASDSISFAVSESPTFSGNVTAQYYFGDGSYLTGVVPVIQEYLFTENASTVAPYYQAVPIDTYVIGNTASATTTVSTTATLIGEFLTNVGFPNATSIPTGQIFARYETQKASGTRSYITYFTLVKRNLAGTETVLLTSDVTSVTNVNTLIQNTTAAINTSVISLLITDRLAIKVYAYTTTGTADISLFWGNLTDSGFDLPLSPPSIATFVPYQNATANIALGSYGISTAGNITAGTVSTTGTTINSNISTTGNVTAGNLLTNGQLSATGTLTVANAAYLGGAAGAESLRVVPAANVSNYFQVTGGDRMVIETVGNTTDVAMSFYTQGSAGIAFNSDSGGSLQFYIGAPIAAINYLTVQGGETGYNAVLSAYQSQDNDAGISYITKGTGSHRFQTDSDGSSSDQFLVAHTDSAVNYLQVAGGNTGNAVTLSAQGSDGNIGILITPKGTGNVNIDANLSVSGNIQAGNTVNWASNGAVAVYQIYNTGTTSLDTIFI